MNRFKLIKGLIGIYFNKRISNEYYYTCHKVAGLLKINGRLFVKRNYFPRCFNKGDVYHNILDYEKVKFKPTRRKALRKLMLHVLINGVKL